MAATTTARRTSRESTYGKAERLKNGNRYLTDARSQSPHFWVGVVQGDHGNYAAFAISQAFMDHNGITGGRLGCNCPAGVRRQLCAHAILAEELRKEGEST